MQELTLNWQVSGEVSEREELLDGRFQVVLDGAAGSAPGVEVTCTLVWLLGREGEVPLSEGYVTVVDLDLGELNASLEAGTVAELGETGAQTVSGGFIVDAVDGGLAVVGDPLRCELEVGVEEWSGRVILGS